VIKKKRVFLRKKKTAKNTPDTPNGNTAHCATKSVKS
jgi:hypothetical protein